jgi:predicted transcriptional regulator
MRIQSLKSLEAEMRAVARGEIPAPADAAEASFNSIAAVLRVLTAENRHLLAVIRNRRPESIGALGAMTGLAAPVLAAKLEELEAAGLVRLETSGSEKIPLPTIEKIHIEIDPYSTEDRLEFA